MATSTSMLGTYEDQFKVLHWLLKKTQLISCHAHVTILNCIFLFSRNEPLIMSHSLWYLGTHPYTNKRSKDLGALLDSCSWDDIGIFLQTCIKNSLVQTKSIEIWVNSHKVPHYTCINYRSYSTP